MGRGCARRRGPFFARGQAMNAVELKSPPTLLQSVRELWCNRCGYGVVVRREAPACPMCRETSWRERPRLARYN
jgi:rubrerythrin